MIPARWPRDQPLDERLLVVDPKRREWRDGHIRDLPGCLLRGDLLVVNDAATIPASFSATDPGGRGIELRLAADLGESRWRAVLFGEGDWRMRTQDRAPPQEIHPGDEVQIGPGFVGTVEEVDRRAPRLIVVRFSARDAALWCALYRFGRPVQYAHLSRPLEVWHAQTPFASRPWAVEMPSASRPLQWSLVAELRRRGVHVAALTLAAGLSSTGDPEIDARLPFPERFDVPRETARAIARTHGQKGRVIAAGTTVVRALEGCAAIHDGDIVAGEGTTDLHITGAYRPRVVDGVLTGLHEVG
ncbi:MAG: S-adenosylmethionine:tRNA ribosyltransferase-isomerase, partial [Myxococcota bacterium]|nr:S-adenosylmethionine:tRNA ribosyltransferase-isomerase [Myxococcota bacterium]